MEFEYFKQKIEEYAKRENSKVSFEYDEDEGKYIAKCTNGYTFTGNRFCKKLSVNWGTGHTAMVSV